ncbi:hypothetical protein PCC7424_5110 [Gloeothece citriformis PCC 7424]|uniref:Uncharacterized protein n=1 Tax=Gloeothece citriformis (strain PCC 7424) TaxID=65393 RepID=B7KGX4_GLOC7|nr:hypothetical protein [Gloeothece citriformis]ACK73461.1 hypothetical protein PCC7424_5110 [Gloeothece citriformis PCC 7424]
MDKQTQLRETLTALIAEHGFKSVIEQLRNYSLNSQREIGLPPELQAFWQQVTASLEQILEIENVEDYNP